MTTEIKYDFAPWDGTPGDAYDNYEVRLLNAGSRADDRGWSLSDHLNGVDEARPAGFRPLPSPPGPLRRRLPVCRQERPRALACRAALRSSTVVEPVSICAPSGVAA